MAIFCTKCGTSNDDVGKFCENCGAQLRASLKSLPASLAPTPTEDTQSQSLKSGRRAFDSKKLMLAGTALAGAVLLAGGATYFLTRPPAATAGALLAAAKAAYGKDATDKLSLELCISNINYSKSTFNAGMNDQNTQAWLNSLVKAGLYSTPLEISSGGFFPHPLLQYVATPELDKYRQGGKLCAAKDVELTEVTEIGKPEEQSFGRNGESTKVLTVNSKLRMKSLNTAPWMELPEVRDEFVGNLSNWEYKDKAFQKLIPMSFGIKDNKWTTGSAYEAQLQKQYQNAQRGNKQAETNDSAKGQSGSFASKLSGLFSFGHPLKGTWRAVAGTGILGIPIPEGMMPNLTFTSDSMELMGQSTQVDFSVDGKRVKVTPKGQSQSLIFVMEDSDTMIAQAMENMRYKRVK
jgi:zinc-ribbon domain